MKHMRFLAQMFSTAVLSAFTATAAAPLEGAEWITVAPSDLPVYPDYLSVFRLGFRLDSPQGDVASVLFGLDDPRLMDANKNIYGLANRPSESYMRVAVDGDSIRVFRRGYAPGETSERELAVFHAEKLTHKGDSIELTLNNGHLDVFVNGAKSGYKGVNPLGNGGDYIAFPVLAQVAVEIPEGSKAAISDLTVSNFREPKNALLRLPADFKDLRLKTKDSHRGMPEMRTVIAVDPKKKVAKATANATAMGIYDLYIDGQRVNEEYFLPGSTQYNKTHLYHTFDLTGRLKPGGRTGPMTALSVHHTR